MLGFLLSFFRMVWLFGKDHRGVVLENLALRQQLSIYKRKHKRPRFVGRDRWFWITLSVLWKDWRRALVIVHPDTVVRWQRDRFRRYWGGLSKRPGIVGRPPISLQIRRLIRTLAKANPLWRAPRIHGELLKLGIAVSERTQVYGAPQMEAKRELQRRLVDFVKRSAEQEGWKPEKDVWVDCPTISNSVQ